MNIEKVDNNTSFKAYLQVKDSAYGLYNNTVNNWLFMNIVNGFSQKLSDIQNSDVVILQKIDPAKAKKVCSLSGVYFAPEPDYTYQSGYNPYRVPDIDRMRCHKEYEKEDLEMCLNKARCGFYVNFRLGRDRIVEDLLKTYDYLRHQ